MCIFNTKVVEVGGTKILVGFLEDGRQVVVYRNYVSVEFDNKGGRKDQAKLDKAKAELDKKAATSGPTPAMILPFPYEKGQPEVELIELDAKKSDGLFTNLKTCFPLLATLEQERSARRGFYSKDAKLEIKKVGSYDVSVAYTVEELSQIDTSVFQLSPQAGELLGRHYGKGFGFIIACLREGGEKHPLAYAHAAWENGKRMFVPTKHFHGGDDSKAEDAKPAHFDHEIYSIGAAAGPDAGESTKEAEARMMEQIQKHPNIWELKKGKQVDEVLQCLPFKMKTSGDLRLLERTGNFENKDVILEVK